MLKPHTGSAAFLNPPMAADATKERWLALDTQIKQQAQTMVEAKRKLRCLERQERRVAESVLEVCFILFVWYAPSGELALAFAAHDTRTKRCRMEVSVQTLEDRYLRTGLDTLAAIESRTGGASKNAIHRAALFERDYNLFHWIQTNNDTKGVAPSVNMVKKTSAAAARCAIVQSTTACRLGCPMCFDHVGAALPEAMGAYTREIPARRTSQRRARALQGERQKKPTPGPHPTRT